MKSLKMNPSNIIIRMPNWIGDAVMATPILADVREKWPNARLTVMCQKSIGDILIHDPHVNEFFIFHKPSGWLHRQEYRDILSPLRIGEYDLGILLTNSFSSAWWFWRGKVKNRVGFATNCRSFLLNYPVPYPENKETQHLVYTYKELLKPLGITETKTSPQLYVTSEEKKEAEDLLSKFRITPSDRVIGINPGAAYGSAKCWPPDRFKEVTLKLLDDPLNHILFFGDRFGSPVVDDICRGMPDRVINLSGRTTLRELVALISLCTFFLTNDSGPMHIASALGIPLLAIFGSTSEVKTGPFNQGEVIHKHVSCSPCYKRVCPIDFRCMNSITAEEVYEKICQRLEKQ
ncbi:MAG: lipopolysaccharide heptosyltransferase II [Chlamydiales bacterium]